MTMKMLCLGNRRRRRGERDTVLCREVATATRNRHTPRDGRFVFTSLVYMYVYSI